MPGSKNNWPASEIRQYLQKHYPGTIFISRKPTNNEALVREKETGRVLFRGRKNYSIVAQITDQENKQSQKIPTLLNDNEIKTKDIKTDIENTAIKAISHLNELRELLNGSFKICKDENGFVKEIRSGELVFTQKSIRS